MEPWCVESGRVRKAMVLEVVSTDLVMGGARVQRCGIAWAEGGSGGRGGDEMMLEGDDDLDGDVVLLAAVGSGRVVMMDVSI